jgi:hypothetical protein
MPLFMVYMMLIDKTSIINSNTFLNDDEKSIDIKTSYNNLNKNKNGNLYNSSLDDVD